MAKETTKTRKKISVTQVKLSDQPEGFTFGGKFVGMTEGKPFFVQDDRGELKESRLTHFVFEDDKGERTAFVGDKGLVNGFETALVKEGDLLEIVKLPKTKLTRGRTMNQYDIFSVQ